MKSLSIEYAHIYTNDKIGEEHELSLKVLDEVQKEDSSLVIMVDDYSFPDPDFDYTELSNWLTARAHKPDIIIRESQLIPLCDEVLKLIEDQNLKEEIGDYVRAKKYPCSLFIASWYLLRIGKIESPMFPKELVAEKLINILPESFKPFEEKALEIIRSTKYSDLIDKIDYKYFKGRKI
ncbi:MAG: hypothetical protein IT284_01190 [Bacteroidetes bacterium]|nr:hypothetical protein [Bacteroidota bacterium]